MTNQPFKILMLVGWSVSKVKEDDKTRHPADILLPNQRYWFFKYWPENNIKIEVMSYKKLPLLSFIEKKVLHFHLFQSIRVLPKMEKYDLLIFFHSQIGIIPALFKSIFKLKTPLVLIDVEGLGRKNSRYLLPLLRRAISGVDYLFYLATIQKQDYQRYFPEIINRCQFLPLGLNLSRFSQNGIRKEDYILSIGYQSSNFRDWKTLIQAYAKLRTKTKLLILGKKKFEPKEIGYEKIPSGVKFMAKTDLPTLNEMVSQSKFVVLPLPERRHAFAQMTLLGCMALGKGLLVSKVSSVIDYLDDHKEALLAEPCNPESLAEKMQFLLDHPDLTNQLGLKAKLKVEKNFTEDRMSQVIYGGLKERNLI